MPEDVISNSLERGLDALELLAEHGEVRLADLAERSDTSSVLRPAAPAELRASTGETVNLVLLRRGKVAYSPGRAPARRRPFRHRPHGEVPEEEDTA